MFTSLSRLVVVVMAGVMCFTLLVPMALRNHQTLLAIGIGVFFCAYAITNVILWRRMNRRA
jgi:amino acid transporter